MIVELFGCPGSGKSFLKREITKSNIETRNSISTNTLKEAIINIVKSLSVFFPSSLRLKRKILKTVKNQRKTPVFIDRPVEVWLNNLVMLNFAYGFYRNKMLIMDEGLVQRTIAMCINFQWNYDITIKILELLPNMKLCKSFFLDVSVCDCLESIKTRNRHMTQMDEMNDVLLSEFVCQYYKYCKKIAEFFCCKRVSRDDYSEIERVL